VIEIREQKSELTMADDDRGRSKEYWW